MGCNITTIDTTICHSDTCYISLADDCLESGSYDYDDVIYCKKIAIYNNIHALYYLKKYYYNNSIIDGHNTLTKFAIYSARYNCLTK